jgi:hypothetical protein
VCELNDEIAVSIHPNVAFHGFTEWKEACFMIYGRSKVVIFFPG